MRAGIADKINPHRIKAVAMMSGLEFEQSMDLFLTGVGLSQRTSRQWPTIYIVQHMPKFIMGKVFAILCVYRHLLGRDRDRLRQKCRQGQWRRHRYGRRHNSTDVYRRRARQRNSHDKEHRHINRHRHLQRQRHRHRYTDRRARGFGLGHVLANWCSHLHRHKGRRRHSHIHIHIGTDGIRHIRVFLVLSVCLIVCSFWCLSVCRSVCSFWC